MSIKVIIAGFKGKMGSEALKMVQNEMEFEPVALIDPFSELTEYQGIPVYNHKEELADIKADVWIDFTTPQVAFENTFFALEHHFAPVV